VTIAIVVNGIANLDLGGRCIAAHKSPFDTPLTTLTTGSLAGSKDSLVHKTITIVVLGVAGFDWNRLLDDLGDGQLQAHSIGRKECLLSPAGSRQSRKRFAAGSVLSEPDHERPHRRRSALHLQIE